MVQGDKQTQPDTVAGLLLRLARTQQFYWFLGHVSLLGFFALDTVTAFFSKGITYYKFSLLSILLSYGIVIRQTHFRSGGVTKLFKIISDRSLRAQLIRDDNVQYFTIALIYYSLCGTLGRIEGSLYLFGIFSIFHVMLYFQSNILPYLPFEIATQLGIDAKISYVTNTYNQQALMVASMSELVRVLASVPALLLLPFSLFRRPIYVLAWLFVFISNVIFLRLRYLSNNYTSACVNDLDAKIRLFLLSGRLPPSLGILYTTKIVPLIQGLTAPVQLSAALPSTKKSN